MTLSYTLSVMKPRFGPTSTDVCKKRLKSDFPSTPLRHFQILAIALLWMIGACVARGAEAPAGADDLPELTNYQTFWNLSEAERGLKYCMRFEADVIFYDPSWDVLWLKNEGVSFFCPTGKKHFEIRAGQKVLLECRVNPINGFLPEDLQFTVLGDAEPLVPLDALELLDNPDDLDKQRVRFTGLVESQQEGDPQHITLHVTLGRYGVEVIVLIDEAEPVRQFVGQRVEVDGLCNLYKAPDTSVGRFIVWVSGQDKVRAIGPLASDEHFSLPVFSGEDLRNEKENSWVRVEGVVRDFQAGRSVVLWDESDQILVQSGQTAVPKVGSRLTATGRLRMRGLQIVLDDAFWMEVDDALLPKGPGEPGLKLRRAVQVLGLGLDEAAQGYPVALYGVVTWADPESDFFFLQDSTRGVCVHLDGSRHVTPPEVGTSVRVTGRTGSGTFAPIVLCDRFEETGALQLPAPRAITLEQSLGGAEEAKLVEIEGYVRAAEEDGRWTVLRLSTPTGVFQARLADSKLSDQAAAQLVGAVVQLRGVCVAQADDNGHQVGIEMLLSDSQEVVVESRPLPDPFSVDTVSVATLRKFGPLQTPYRWVRTSGIVTYAAEGRFILQSGDAGVEVFCRDQDEAVLGDAVEVVGFSGRQGSRIVLREAQVRNATNAESPRVAMWSGGNAVDAELDDRLVRIDAHLEDILQTEQGALLYLRAGAVRFLGYSDAGTNLDLRQGSLLRCVGVYRIEQNPIGRTKSFNILFRRGDDITVLKPPSLFTVKSALLAMAVISLGAGAALLWASLLRKQVSAQTRQIREQLERQAKLESELQKVAKLESLGQLAGGIAHDFNNLLTVVMGNIALAMREGQVMAAAGDCLLDAERGAQRAKDLTQQLLTFAKGGEPLLAAEILPEIVRETAEFVLRGSSVRCDYEFEAGLWPADVDCGQIGQVVHNLVLNSMQAMPDGGVVRVKAHNEVLDAKSVGGLPSGRYVRLSIADTGPGISGEALSQVFDPYYTTKKGSSGLGLATVHSIVRRHRGHIEVHSEMGHGAVFNIWLPAAEGEVVKKEAPVAPKPQSLTGRVLVMDDEDCIRRMIVMMLRRLGLDPVGVVDGTEAIRVYQEARAEGKPFALAIMDLTVPGGMGGREAMEELLRIDPGIKAIVSSGYSNDLVMANYRDYGFSGMVAKPYEVEELMECVGRILSES